jgi:hypothetical protein
MAPPTPKSAEDEHSNPAVTFGQTLDMNIVLGDNNTAFAADGTTVVSFNVSTLQQNWAYTSTGGTLSFIGATSGGGVAIEDSQLGLVTVDSQGNSSTPLAGFGRLFPWAFGLWPVQSNNELAFVLGPDLDPSASFFQHSQGGAGQNRSAKPVLAHFLPVAPADTYPAPELKSELEGSHSYLTPTSATEVYAFGSDATVSRFQKAIADPSVGAVGFIGHSAYVTTSPYYSVGLCFYDNCIQLRPNQTYNYTPLGTPVLVDKIQTNAKVFFDASCYVGPAFESLFKLSKGHALICPSSKNPGVESQGGANLFAGKDAWLYLATYLVEGKTVTESVNAVSDFMSYKRYVERWDYIGDGNATIIQQAK